jgi:hypothetical protein
MTGNRDYTAWELDAMTLDEFKQTPHALYATWDGYGDHPVAQIECTELAKDNHVVYRLGPISQQTQAALNRIRHQQGKKLGTFELLEAIRSCRGGLACGFVHGPKLATSNEWMWRREEYPAEDNHLDYTHAACRVMKQAFRFVEESQPPELTNEHLLLALLEVDNTDVERLFGRRKHDYDFEGMNRSLRGSLRLDTT